MINIAFICTHNSCRSIMAEALAKAYLTKKISFYSAGSKPSGMINPQALEILQSNEVDTKGLYSKSIDDLRSFKFDNNNYRFKNRKLRIINLRDTLFAFEKLFLREPHQLKNHINLIEEQLKSGNI